jgi:small-conductance mechanosensitive channel/CRP-like cAMP-binding protein
MTRIVGRIWAPGLLFLAFALGAVWAPGIMQALDERVALGLSDIAPYAAQIGLWLTGAFLAIRLAQVTVWDRIKGPHGQAVPRLARDLVAIVIAMVAVAGIVGGVFHQSLAGLWATSGAVGIVLGLALRGIILDTFTGLFINIDHSYRIGDWIELMDRNNGAPIYGKVVEIDWRTTRIESDDKRIYLVPNSRMGTITIANYSLPNDVCRFETRFVFDFSVDPERVIRVLQAGAKAVAGRRGLVEKPEPTAIVGSATPDGIEYTLRYWVAVSEIPRQVARHVVTHSALQHIAQAGLTPAYPKQDTFHARLPNRQIAHNSASDRARLLGAIDILRELTAAELEALAGEVTPRLIEAGTTLVRAGEQSASMFVIAEGLLDVWVDTEGGRVKLSRIAPGEVAGEMSLLTGEPRSATLVAATDALVYEIDREHLTPILAARPALFEAISEIVAARRLRASKTLAETAAAHEVAEVASLSAQILGKMRMFFRTIGHRSGGEIRVKS